MEVWAYLQLHKWETPFIWCFFVFTIIWVMIRMNGNKKIMRLVYFQIMVVAIYYFPFFKDFMIEHFFPSYLEYERITWLFFVMPMLSLYLVLILNYYEKKKGVVVIIALIFMVQIFENADSSVYYIQPENKFELSEIAVELADSIAVDADCYTEDKYVKVDDQGEPVRVKTLVISNQSFYDYSDAYNVYYGIRQYSAAIQLGMAYIPDELLEQTADKLEAVGVTQYNYIVAKDLEEYKSYLSKIGAIEIDSSGDYLLYKVVE